MKNTINLNGIWKFAPTYDQKPTNNHNVSFSRIPIYASDELCRKHWEDVEVPGVWQRYGEKYSVFEGVCWFYREFEVDSFDKDFFANLVFKGVNYKADVYVNSELAGVHESAYTEFSFDISKFLKQGSNFISVQVDNRPTEVKWPNDWGYGVFGGIHRDVYIEVFDKDSVYDIELTPDFDIASNEGILNVCAKGNAPKMTIKIDGAEFEMCSKSGVFSGQFRLSDITPWSPENPKLYPVEISVKNEVYASYNVGFRNIFRKNRKLMLNGKPFEVKGACYLTDTPKSGLAVTKEEIRFDLLKMKEANVNSVRTHYPMPDSFYELCDEMGLTVWIEPNIYCSKPDVEQTNTVFARKEFIDVAVSMTEEMIFCARRFASVVIYGIGNECNTMHPETVPFFEKISDVVRKSDNTRLVGYASLYGLVGKIAHTVDVMGINSYCGWYGVINNFTTDDDIGNEVRKADVSAVHEIIERVEKEVSEDAVLLLTEFGADSEPGYISDKCHLWSENFHAEIVKNYIEAGREHESVSGYYVFAFTDYNDPSKPMNGRWNGFNLKGMLTYEREIKLPFYALKEAYSLDKQR